MSYFSQFAGGPAKVTTYTSGSGNFTPISVNQSFARVTVVGGGGGGQQGYAATTTNSRSAGGAAGATKVEWVKLTQASYAYSVGAGGNGGTTSPSNGSLAAGNAGSKSYFGSIIALGGNPGATASTRPTAGANTATITYRGNVGTEGYMAGERSGGVGGTGVSASAGTGGGMYGFPTYGGSGGEVTSTTLGNTYVGRSSGSDGGGGGGDSLYGIGGDCPNSTTNGAAGNAGSGYGAGGGGGGGANANNLGGTGGAGSGGIIIVEEFVY